MLQPRFRIHAPFARANDGGPESNKNGWAMTEKEERLARDRAEIAARVASFRETQQKFERAREEYYETTLANALNGSGRPSFWRWGGTGRSLPDRRVIPGGIWRLEPQANSTRKCRRQNSQWQERSRCFDVFLSSAATLREVKAWKTPSASSNVGGVFRLARTACDRMRSRAMRSGGSDHRFAGTNTALAEFSSGKGVTCPCGWTFWSMWWVMRASSPSRPITDRQMKISRSEKFPDRWAPNCRAFSLPYAVRPRCGPACRPWPAVAAFSLRPQWKADDDEGKAEQQADHHDAPVGRFVRVVKRRDHGLFSFRPSLSQRRIRTTRFGF
jgi:hypothetical protein